VPRWWDPAHVDVTQLAEHAEHLQGVGLFKAEQPSADTIAADGFVDPEHQPLVAVVVPPLDQPAQGLGPWARHGVLDPLGRSTVDLPPEGKVKPRARLACDRPRKEADMRIGALADELGLNPKTVRYYERIGLLPEPRRTPAGYRDYDETTADLVQFIKAAQRLGLSLDAIRDIVTITDRAERPCPRVRELLRRKVADIDTQIAGLTQLRTQLAAIEEHAEQLIDRDSIRCALIEHGHEDHAAS
jgi:DNA-binding transcriptional MerR regulator